MLDSASSVEGSSFTMSTLARENDSAMKRLSQRMDNRNGIVSHIMFRFPRQYVRVNYLFQINFFAHFLLNFLAYFLELS